MFSISCLDEKTEMSLTVDRGKVMFGIRTARSIPNSFQIQTVECLIQNKRERGWKFVRLIYSMFFKRFWRPLDAIFVHILEV